MRPRQDGKEFHSLPISSATGAGTLDGNTSVDDFDAAIKRGRVWSARCFAIEAHPLRHTGSRQNESGR